MQCSCHCGQNYNSDETKRRGEIQTIIIMEQQREIHDIIGIYTKSETIYHACELPVSVHVHMSLLL